MKNTNKGYLKIARIIALAAIIGFTMAACIDGGNTDDERDLTGTITIDPNTNVYIGTKLTAKYNGTETVSYQWKKDTSNIGTDSKEFTPAEPGSYTVTVSASGYKSRTSTAVTVNARQGIDSPVTFTNTIEFASWLTGQPENDLNSVYQVKLNVNDLGRGRDDAESVGYILKNNDKKLIRLDLSGSTFTSVEENAFKSCDNLAGITLPNTVTTIGDYAFNNCSLLSITIPDSVTSIGEYAFSLNVDLASVTLGNKVERIEEYAFSGCEKLTGIAIPASVTFIDEFAFVSCNNLVEITVAPGNSTYSSQDGVLFNKTKTILFNCPEGKTGSFSIPNTVNKIEPYAFLNCAKLTGITIPNSVTEIKEYAFSGCEGLTGITIPNAINYIGEYAFVNCNGLISVKFENASISTIKDNAFGVSDEDGYIGDLVEKYTDTNGGAGTYKRTNSTSFSWTKQQP